MKPIALDMRAFGPYGDHAAVDFEPLAEVGLFVVSGPTGAGKSTIFDAICFALYGSLSGARANHHDVRSHYADPHAKCSVTLVFDAEGQRWRVTRQPSQTVQKRRGTGTTVQPATAVLERWDGSDWAPDTTKVRDVTARTKELVGLTLEQFERVVLLPQGKFAEVLNAKTSERSDLLRTLFGSEIFDRATDILNERAKEGERSLRGVNEQRAIFHQRAVDAIEQIDAALEQLPAHVKAFIERRGDEHRGDEHRGDGASEGVGDADRQLSLLDLDLTPEPAASNEQPEDPAVRLAGLAAGPVTALEALVERRRSEAELARTERDRAETQRRAIEQRAETVRLLALLESRTTEMSELAERATSARSLLGLQPALAERQRLIAEVARIDEAQRALANRIVELAPSVLSPEALGPLALGADTSAPVVTADQVAQLLDLIAAQSAALDRVAEERDRVDRVRREQAAVAERVAHLDSLEERAEIEARAEADEVTTLDAAAAELQPITQHRAVVVDQLTAIDGTISTRRRCDDAEADLRKLIEQRDAADAAATAARASVHAANEEIDRLSAEADQLGARRIQAEQATRRCHRRGELEQAMAELAKATDLADTSKSHADTTFAAFVGHTAPRLAAELVDDEPCPVCGSHEHPSPAHRAPDAAGSAVDARAVEQASAAASAAEAEQSRWRTVVANLIDDDRDLATAEPAMLAEAEQAAIAALVSAEEAAAHREQLVASMTALQDHIATTVATVERMTAEATHAQLGVRELEGALGDAVTHTVDDLVARRSELTQQLDAIVRAEQRLMSIGERRSAIISAREEQDRLSRQRAVDRATAAERAEQLQASIETAERSLDAILGGEQLSAKQEALSSLRSALTTWQEQSLSLARSESAVAASESNSAAVISAAGFDSEDAAVAAALPLAAIEQAEAAHGRWSHELAAHRATLATLDTQDLPDEPPDLDELTAKAIAAAGQHREAAEALAAIDHAMRGARADLDEVALLDASHAERRAEHDTVQRVANVVRGQNSRRLSLENWVLSVYLHDVVDHANLHLATMSNGRYRLAVQDAPSSQVGQHGLDLAVDDAHTGRLRSSMSLSGGETFQASLALALGLADVVMLGRAGLHLDALFVDEGFGSLDADAIDQAITVLDGLRSRGSMVGVITHVDALKNALPVAIDVQPRSDHRGSSIRQVA